MSVMPAGLRYERPTDLSQAIELLKREGAVAMAGGQSLLAAMKLGLNDSKVLVDLQAISDLQAIELQGDRLIIGAMATHAKIAASPLVAQFAPGLCSLAQCIADQQVRNIGTMGGSLANNDPAACWPAAVLAAEAVVVTTQRRIPANDFFQGVYTTALKPQEIITAVEWSPVLQFSYLKFEQKASRFALVGVAVAQAKGGAVRVAITGLGRGVSLWHAAGDALAGHFSVRSLDNLFYAEDEAQTDLHASAAYRAHLVRVLARRCVTQISKENPALPGIKSPQRAIDLLVHASYKNEAPGLKIQGEQRFQATVERVWQALFNPTILQKCIAGCDSFNQISPTGYQAVVKVGLGPVAARFIVDVQIQDIQAPQSCVFVFSGNAGALGAGQGRAHVTLRAESTGSTHLHWQTQSRVNGRLAQLGSRLISASVNKLSGDFFREFSRQLSPASPIQTPPSLWQALITRFRKLFSS